MVAGKPRKRVRVGVGLGEAIAGVSEVGGGLWLGWWLLRWIRRLRKLYLEPGGL